MKRPRKHSAQPTNASQSPDNGGELSNADLSPYLPLLQDVTKRIEREIQEFEFNFISALIHAAGIGDVLQKVATKFDYDVFMWWLENGFPQREGGLSLHTCRRWVSLAAQMSDLIDQFLATNAFDRDQVFNFIHRKDGTN
ncbi:MAG: hypothetical protein K2Y37_27050 [Pirellulales bacterium]|nr:hypothetical protein [Pirellulales bacterium]